MEQNGRGEGWAEAPHFKAHYFVDGASLCSLSLRVPEEVELTDPGPYGETNEWGPDDCKHCIAAVEKRFHMRPVRFPRARETETDESPEWADDGTPLNIAAAWEDER